VKYPSLEAPETNDQLNIYEGEGIAPNAMSLSALTPPPTAQPLPWRLSVQFIATHAEMPAAITPQLQWAPPHGRARVISLCLMFQIGAGKEEPSQLLPAINETIGRSEMEFADPSNAGREGKGPRRQTTGIGAGKEHTQRKTGPAAIRAKNG